MDQALLVHEAVHADQWARYGGGVLFPTLYGIQHVRAGNGNRFERAAREAERAAKERPSDPSVTACPVDGVFVREGDASHRGWMAFKVINPAEIPRIPGDMEALRGYARGLQEVGGRFGDTGADVNTAWQGLAPVYDTPESDLLLAATGPVASTARDVGDDLAAVGDALATYAATVAPIKARLGRGPTGPSGVVAPDGPMSGPVGDGSAGLIGRAHAFAASLPSCDPDDWRDDFELVNEHNRLLTAINYEVEAWMTAQRTCANAINALYGGTQWTAADTDGAAEGTAFGFSAHTLDALAAEQGLPWGAFADHDRGFWPGAVEFVWGFLVDGLWADIDSMEDMIGLNGGDAFTNYWADLGELVLALNGRTTDNGIKGWLEPDPNIASDARKNLIKGLIVPDNWGDDGLQPKGQLGYNLAGVGVGVFGIFKAAKAARTRRATDPPTNRVSPDRLRIDGLSGGSRWNWSTGFAPDELPDWRRQRPAWEWERLAEDGALDELTRPGWSPLDPPSLEDLTAAARFAPERPAVPPHLNRGVAEDPLSRYNEVLAYQRLVDGEPEIVRAGELSRQLRDLPRYHGTTFAVENLSAEDLSRFEPGRIFTTNDVTVTAFGLGNFRSRWSENNAVIAYTGRSGRDVSPLTKSYVHQVYYDRHTTFRVAGRTWDKKLGKWIITVEDAYDPPPGGSWIEIIDEE